MKTCRSCQTQKPLDDFYRSGKDPLCKPCRCKIHKQWRIDNRESFAASRKLRRQLNPEQAKKWKIENPEKYKEGYTRYNKVAAHARHEIEKRRRLIKKGRTVISDVSEIREIYKKAREMRESGNDVHVDHIIPLFGKNVSGLHVSWNLRIIPAHENISKGARLLNI